VTREEWYNLKAGDVVQHKDGTIEHIVEYFDGEKFINGPEGKSIFPLYAFNWNDFTKIENREV